MLQIEKEKIAWFWKWPTPRNNLNIQIFYSTSFWLWLYSFRSRTSKIIFELYYKIWRLFKFLRDTQQCMKYQEWKILSPFICIPAAWNYRHFHRNCKKWEQEYETISLWSKWVSETKYVLKYRNETNWGGREMQSVQCCLSCMWKRFFLNRLLELESYFS